MAAIPLRQGSETNDPAGEPQAGWDATRVWRERVSNGPTSVAASQPSQGWDPYLVWLSRVKKA